MVIKKYLYIFFFFFLVLPAIRTQNQKSKKEIPFNGWRRRKGEGAVVKAREFLIHNCVAKREVYYMLYRVRKEADLAGYNELLHTSWK